MQEFGWFICEPCGKVHRDCPFDGYQLIFPTERCRIKPIEGPLPPWQANDFTDRSILFPCLQCKQYFRAKQLRCADVKHLDGALCISCCTTDKQRMTLWCPSFCRLTIKGG